MIPENLFMVFSVIGMLTVAGISIEVFRNGLHYARHRKLPPSQEAIKAEKRISALSAELQSATAALDVQTEQNKTLMKNLEHTLEKLTNQV